MEEITITGTGSDMQGVGRLGDGRAAFVPGALTGERVLAEITKDAGRFCEARLVKVVSPSPHRVEPDCPYFGSCGGCRLRNADMALGLDMKRTRVFDALSRIAGIAEPNVPETIGCDETQRMRNKAEYPIENGIIGMRTAGGRSIVPIDDCLLQSQLSLSIMRRVRDLARGSGLSGYLVTRVNRAGEAMAIISSRGRAPAWLKSLAAVDGVVSVYHCALSQRPSHALDGKCAHICGKKQLSERICDLDFSISPQTFFQVNTLQAEKLYNLALDAAGIGEKSRVLDAYCGCGTMTLAAARRAKFALGVEIVAPAIDDARENAVRNALTDKAAFVCADAGLEIPRRFGSGERFDAMIVDPPRKGCDAALISALVACGPERIAYVSCDPGTLARDVKLLREGGYELRQAQPVDMFPYTAHVECVVLMSRVKE